MCCVLVFLNVTTNDALLAWMLDSPRYTYVLQKNPQEHRYTIVALHVRSISNGIKSKDGRGLALGLAVV
jgi:hypothetical protein